ncbi:GTP-binding protein, partial [Patescibacteria group bacterium]|nr:GTP-binding protein [Patescibacteria group bacterium]
IYNDTKINIIDTPGHADFGGEVERTLNMADGAILLIDAQEGPMPQTKFVLKKALEMGLKVIVVINKIDKPNADVEHTVNKTYDLFLDLAQNDTQLDFPIFYAIGRDGKSWVDMPKDFSADADLSPILDAIIRFVPAPDQNSSAKLQMLISALDSDDFVGKYVIGKIKNGTMQSGMSVTVINEQGIVEQGKIDKIFITQGLKKIEVQSAQSGDIVSVSGLKKAMIGDTIADAAEPEFLPHIAIEEPTLSISLYANTSPFAGREGKFVTARQLLDRIKKELETNISMRLEIAADGNFILYGRGELHLSVFIETLRREGYEMQIGKPQVVTKVVNGATVEPIKELTVDVMPEYASAVIGEINKRRGIMLKQEDNADGSVRMIFEISERGLIGLRNVLLTNSKGTAVMNSLFLRFDKISNPIPKLRNGVLIAHESGKAVAYGLESAQQRGTTFIGPATEVYAGMIVGLNSREEDMEINVTKEKKLTNMRAAHADIATILTPPTILSLEQSMDFLEDDELLEVTPTSLRMRKKLLDKNDRIRAKRAGNK